MIRQISAHRRPILHLITCRVISPLKSFVKQACRLEILTHKIKFYDFNSKRIVGKLIKSEFFENYNGKALVETKLVIL